MDSLEKMLHRGLMVCRATYVLIAFGAIVCSLLCADCMRPPSVAEAIRTDWSVDTTRDWEQRLHCAGKNGIATFLSTGDIPMVHQYTNVVYVLERRGDYWIGYTYLDRTMTANLPVKAWSLDSAYCWEAK